MPCTYNLTHPPSHNLTDWSWPLPSRTRRTPAREETGRINPAVTHLSLLVSFLGRWYGGTHESSSSSFTFRYTYVKPSDQRHCSQYLSFVIPPNSSKCLLSTLIRNLLESRCSFRPGILFQIGMSQSLKSRPCSKCRPVAFPSRSPSSIHTETN